MAIARTNSSAMRSNAGGVGEAEIAAELCPKANPVAIEATAEISNNWLKQVGAKSGIDFRQPPRPQHNQLLSALPADTRQRILCDLELVHLDNGKTLYESSDAYGHVYFPTDSIISLLAIMESGASAEISVVGCEGVIGISSFMGGDRAPRKAIVLNAGYAYRLQAERLREECNRHSQTLELMLRYTQVLLTQMAQTAACNLHHSINQRLCRWLLLALDRLPGNQMAMTQEQIANLLGVRREGVTEAAGKLQKMGVIEYFRGHIMVLDRSKLEHLSCECYAVIKKETDRLLPKAHTPSRNIHVVHRTVSTGRK